MGINTNKKYDIILADPPWLFNVWNVEKSFRHASYKYPVMGLKSICDLPVSSIASDNSVLFLWATSPNLLNSIEVINSWGFKYATIGFTWVKKNKKSDSLFWGMGFYTRANVELCLLATRGKPLPRISHSVHQVIQTPIEEHSKKPDEARTRIVELFGDLPRIELFARQKVDGWDALGYDIDGMDIRESLKLYDNETYRRPYQFSK